MRSRRSSVVYNVSACCSNADADGSGVYHYRIRLRESTGDWIMPRKRLCDLVCCACPRASMTMTGLDSILVGFYWCPMRLVA